MNTSVKINTGYCKINAGTCRVRAGKLDQDAGERTEAGIAERMGTG